MIFLLYILHPIKLFIAWRTSVGSSAMLQELQHSERNTEQPQ